MTWFNLALLAAILFAWVTIIDKLMVDRNFTDPFMYSLFIRLYGLISATAFVLLAGGWQSLPAWAVGAAMLAGALKIGSGAIYFFSLTRGDASLISAVAQTRPLFALLWGVGLLGERLNPLAYLGVTIVVLGTILLSIERDHAARKALRLNRVVALMLLSNVFHSLAGLSLKVALQEATPENGYFWEVVGSILVGGRFFPSGHRDSRG